MVYLLYRVSREFCQIFGEMKEYVILSRKSSIHICIFRIIMSVRWILKVKIPGGMGGGARLELPRGVASSINYDV